MEENNYQSLQNITSHFSNLSQISNQYEEKKRNVEKLDSYLKILSDELEITTNSEAFLNSTASRFSHSFDTIKLKEALVKLQQKYDDLELHYNKTKEENLQLRSNKELVESRIKAEFKIKKHLLEKTFKEKVETIRNNFIEEQTNYLVKEQDLVEKLHSCQALAALDLDDVECKLKSQLSEANRQLRDSNYSRNILTSELLDLKNRNGCNFSSDELQKIAELEEKVQCSAQELQITQDKLNEAVRKNSYAKLLCNSDKNKHSNNSVQIVKKNCSLGKRLPKQNVKLNIQSDRTESSFLNLVKPSTSGIRSSKLAMRGNCISDFSENIEENKEKASTPEKISACEANVKLSKLAMRGNCTSHFSENIEENKEKASTLEKIPACEANVKLRSRKRKLYNPQDTDYISESLNN